MRIAMVSEHASPLAALGGPDAGGQNVYVARLSGTLARRGHEVTVYTRRDAHDLPRRQAMPDGVTVEHVPAGPAEAVPKDSLQPYMPAFGGYLARAWAGRAPAVVHAHFWMSGIAALAGARPHGVPVVQTFHALGTVKRRHQQERDTSPRERVRCEREIGRSCAGVLATCSDEVQELAAMGVPPQQATVVPCGVDADLFRPAGAARPSGDGPAGPRRQRHRLLAIGRLVPRKGFDQAIRALVRLPETELVITGGPPAAQLAAEPEAARLTELAAALGVRDRVHLTGGVPHELMPELIRGSDLVLSTPEYEPFGIVPLEAMACAVPVVATRVGGHQDTVDDGVTGHLVPPGDADALARTVADVLADPQVLHRFGDAGRRRVLERYTWERVADGVEQLYERVVARPRIPSGVAR
jgi:glycosyltransferase involved in cell wall biosynthesis